MKPIEPLEEISIESYNKLSNEEKGKYIGIYKTKKIRKRSECETCGHFQGYYQGTKNIGKPISYRKKSVWELSSDVMAKQIVNFVLNPNPFLGKEMKIPIRFKKGI